MSIETIKYNNENINEEEVKMLEKLKKEFTRQVLEGYGELAKTAEIAPTSNSYGWTAYDIINNDNAMKKVNENIDESASIELRDEDLTEIGKYLKENLKDDTLIDLGCGNQIFIPNLAKAFRAKRYIGIDIEAVDHGNSSGDFEKYTLNGDMLITISKIPDGYGSFYLSGIEDYSGEIVQEFDSNGEYFDTCIEPSSYTKKLLEEIYRVTRKDGLLILGANNTLPNPESVGFEHLELKNSGKNMGLCIHIKK